MDHEQDNMLIYLTDSMVLIMPLHLLPYQQFLKGTITINAQATCLAEVNAVNQFKRNTTITLNSTASGGGGASSSQTVTAQGESQIGLDYIAATEPCNYGFLATSGKVIVLEEAICFIDADAV